jgi:hypothetical protein
MSEILSSFRNPGSKFLPKKIPEILGTSFGYLGWRIRENTDGYRLGRTGACAFSEQSQGSYRKCPAAQDPGLPGSWSGRPGRLGLIS